MIMISFTGAPSAVYRRPDRCAAAGTLRLAAIRPWRRVPLILVLALALWLPESPRFLARRQNLSPTHAARCAASTRPTEAAVDVAQGKPPGCLSHGYAPQTILLWIIYFCSPLNLFLFATGCRRC
jgi:hypothetical protein